MARATYLHKFSEVDIVTLLNDALEQFYTEGDCGALMQALDVVTRYKVGGLQQLARLINTNRQKLYRTFDENGNPKLRTFVAILAALGYKLSIEPITSGKKPLEKDAERQILKAVEVALAD